MTTLRYNVHISADGMISLPDWTGGEVDANLTVAIPAKTPQVDPSAIQPNGKTAVEDFLQFCTGIVGDISDEELDRLKYERLTEKYR